MTPLCLDVGNQKIIPRENYNLTQRFLAAPKSYIDVFMYSYNHIDMYIYIYIYRERERVERERERDRETEGEGLHMQIRTPCSHEGERASSMIHTNFVLAGKKTVENPAPAHPEKQSKTMGEQWLSYHYRLWHSAVRGTTVPAVHGSK